MKKNYYRIYELNIESEILLPELVTAEGKNHAIDVNIRYGKLTEEAWKSIEEGKRHGFLKNEMWFYIRGVAGFLIKNGNEIIVEPGSICDVDSMRLFILGSVSGMLLIQRNIPAVHGSTLVIDDEAIIITGDSGAGKSTLSAALLNSGFKFLADDISVIGEDDNKNLVVKPGFPQQKLSKDILENFGYDVNDFDKVNDDKGKYSFPIGDKFVNKPVKLNSIFEVSFDDTITEVKLEKVTGSKKIEMLRENIYVVEVTDYTGMDLNLFKQNINICNKINFYRIIRPKKGFTVEKQVELLEEIIRKKDF